MNVFICLEFTISSTLSNNQFFYLLYDKPVPRDIVKSKTRNDPILFLKKPDLIYYKLVSLNPDLHIYDKLVSLKPDLHIYDKLVSLKPQGRFMDDQIFKNLPPSKFDF